MGEAVAAHARLPRAGYLAVVAPVAYAALRVGFTETALLFGVLALVGGAFILGEAAEVVARRVGEAVGALLTASLSNVVTLALLGAALVDGHYDLVRASVIGAILGNLLVALGGGMLLGGLGRERQRFGREAAATNTTLLLVASFALLFPTLAAAGLPATADFSPRAMTVPLAIVLLLTYFTGLVFSVRTHKHLFDVAQGVPKHRAHPLVERFAVIVLVAAVALVAWMGDLVANVIVPVGARFGLSPFFLGIVVIGALANSVEISAAWRFARADRMNLTLQIATGSGIQVMLFVVPVLVLVSLVLPTGVLALAFMMPMALAVLMSAVLVNVVSADGESTWYEGLMLVALFCVIGVAFYVIR